MIAFREGEATDLQGAESFAARPFERVTRLAATIFGAAHAFVTLTEAERAHLEGVLGHPLPPAPEEALLGGTPFLAARPLAVGDARRHPRLSAHPAVSGEHAIRFVAVAPLLGDDDVLLGVLNVLDSNPRAAGGQREREILESLAALARDELDRLASSAVAATPATDTAQASLPSTRAAAWELDEVRRRARDDERMRIARELHDGLGKDLFGLALLVESVADRQKGRAVSHELREYAATARRLANEARALLRSYREEDGPSLPDNQFLENRLRGAVSDHEDAGGPPVRTELLPVPPVPAWAVHELERIVRESLRNVRRHSNAKNVRVALSTNGSELSLTIEDDGRGLPGGLPSGTYGLVGMRERAQLLGGELTVNNRPEGGVAIRGRFPLSRLTEEESGE
jgi:signal transduction histidine kinase